MAWPGSRHGEANRRWCFLIGTGTRVEIETVIRRYNGTLRGEVRGTRMRSIVLRTVSASEHGPSIPPAHRRRGSWNDDQFAVGAADA